MLGELKVNNDKIPLTDVVLITDSGSDTKRKFIDLFCFRPNNAAEEKEEDLLELLE